MRIWAMLIFLCAGVAMAADATTQPEIVALATGPTTGPTMGPTTAPAVVARPTTRISRTGNFRNSNRPNRRSISVTPNMPTIYEQVATRNIFVKGQQHFIPSSSSENSGRGYGAYVPTPNQLLLTGVSLADNGKVAFLEDQQANLVDVVKVGDKISSGKVIGMTLDSLDYQDVNGKTVRVEVGFNLAGGDVWGISSSSSSSSTRPSTQPAGTGPRGPGESMDDYLKRRRAAEMAH